MFVGRLIKRCWCHVIFAALLVLRGPVSRLLRLEVRQINGAADSVVICGCVFFRYTLVTVSVASVVWMSGGSQKTPSV